MARNLDVLFPAVAAPNPPAYCVRSSWDWDTDRPTKRNGMVLCPGLLRTPAFHKHFPWISGTVWSTWRNGLAQAGWIAEALAQPIAPAMLAQGRSLAARLVREETGGTFWAAPPDPAIMRGRTVLVKAGNARSGTRAMLKAALDHHESVVILLVLPQTDHIMARAADRCGIAVIAGAVDPWPLLAQVTDVHAASGHDELAVLARLAGITVHCHSPGLADRHTADEIAAACLVQGAVYANPFTDRPIECATALDIAAEWRRVTRSNRAIGACAGMSFWKRRRIGAFFHTGERSPPHRRHAAAAIRAAKGNAVAVWSSRMPPGLTEAAAATGTRLLRVEDGFIRSFGLGSGFLPPCSIIVDASGIYYDPSGPSDLETLLRETRFTPDMLLRARCLMDRLVREGVTKYGADTTPVTLPLPLARADGRRRILVPGQVADDLSVRLGGAGIAGNEALLARVRAAHPDALVIYKPHPDVDAGHRAGAVPDAMARRYADCVVRGVPMASLIAAVDEIHTLTSLAGYEALLRGRRVVVYGRPFYAGWGLTEDMAPMPGRDRRLSLEELSAGVLLLYPRYIDPVTELPCPAEILLDRLASRAIWRPTGLMRLREWQGQLRIRLAGLRLPARRSSRGSGS